MLRNYIAFDLCADNIFQIEVVSKGEIKTLRSPSFSSLHLFSIGSNDKGEQSTLIVDSLQAKESTNPSEF